MRTAKGPIAVVGSRRDFLSWCHTNGVCPQDRGAAIYVGYVEHALGYEFRKVVLVTLSGFAEEYEAARCRVRP